MIKITEADKFELGTISIFTGLALITFIPVLMKLLFIYIEPDFFRMIGGFFILMSAIFYYLSPGYYKKQFFILGINLIIFSFFQIFFSPGMQDVNGSVLITPILGIFLIAISLYLDRSRK